MGWGAILFWSWAGLSILSLAFLGGTLFGFMKSCDHACFRCKEAHEGECVEEREVVVPKRKRAKKKKS